MRRGILAAMAPALVAMAWGNDLELDSEMLEPVTVQGSVSQEAGPSEAEAALAEVMEASMESGLETEAAADETESAVDESAAEPEVESLSEEDLALKEMDEEAKRLRKERDLLALQNALRAEQFKAEVADVREQKERMALENALLREQVATELAQTKVEVDRMNAEIDRINKEMSLAGMKMKQELQAELADLRRQDEVLTAKNSIVQKEMEVKLNEARLMETQLKLRRSELEMEVLELQAKLTSEEKKDQIRDQIYDVEDEMYLKEPYIDGVLHISDRRIALNGVIWNQSAEHVSERINFFNNQTSEYPIFLVIDNSPGGSVMSGYNILKAMEGSAAPVYVVVKSYAASMAATIATLAERSFAYPNAVILHHQLSWYSGGGNLTQQKELVEEAEEWWRRLAKPVAAKMGLTLDEFIAKMYQNNSDGDWSEFADVAKELNWVDEVVDRIWERSIDKNPDSHGFQIYAQKPLEEKIDDKGRPFVELPRLSPFDFYFVYNPDGYYRLQ